MSEDHEERGRIRRRDVLRELLRASDAGEVLSIPTLHKRMPWGADITKHGLIYVVEVLEEQGYVERRWGANLETKMTSGKRSYVLLKALAYRERASIAGS